MDQDPDAPPPVPDTGDGGETPMEDAAGAEGPHSDGLGDTLGQARAEGLSPVLLFRYEQAIRRLGEMEHYKKEAAALAETETGLRARLRELEEELKTVRGRAEDAERRLSEPSRNSVGMGLSGSRWVPVAVGTLALLLLLASGITFLSLRSEMAAQASSMEKRLSGMEARLKESADQAARHRVELARLRSRIAALQKPPDTTAAASPAPSAGMRRVSPARRWRSSR